MPKSGLYDLSIGGLNMRLTFATSYTWQQFEDVHIEMLEIEDKERDGTMTKKDLRRFQRIVGINMHPQQYREILG